MSEGTKVRQTFYLFIIFFTSCEKIHFFLILISERRQNAAYIYFTINIGDCKTLKIKIFKYDGFLQVFMLKCKYGKTYYGSIVFRRVRRARGGA